MSRIAAAIRMVNVRFLSRWGTRTGWGSVSFICRIRSTMRAFMLSEART